jgi:hypothetical protein
LLVEFIKKDAVHRIFFMGIIYSFRAKSEEKIFMQSRKCVITTLFGNAAVINFPVNTKLKYADVAVAALKVRKACTERCWCTSAEK